MKYGFVGDREISVRILKLLIDSGYKPSFLFVNKSKRGTHALKLMELSNLDQSKVFTNYDLNDSTFLEKIKEYNVDYIFGIHYPFIINNEFLEIPKVGFLNLHPAYLPYNKGWHTPSWAIYEQTKYGATLHYMSEKLDEGDIIHQKEEKILQEDTADSLYKRTLQLEYEVFKEALPDLISLKPNRYKQGDSGTEHKKSDLNNIREISLDEEVNPLDLINKLRALTTSDSNEAAYFIKDGNKYTLQIKILKQN